MKKINQRQYMRIAARRAGCWSGWTREDKVRIRQRREFISNASFWGGAAFTLFTGGAGLPLAALFMAPKLVDMATDKPVTPPPTSPPGRNLRVRKSRVTRSMDMPHTPHPETQRTKVRESESLAVEKPGPADASVKDTPIVQKQDAPEPPKAPKKPKKEPKNHQTKAQEKKPDLSLEARKRRLQKLRRDNKWEAADRLAFFRDTN